MMVVGVVKVIWPPDFREELGGVGENVARVLRLATRKDSAEGVRPEGRVLGVVYGGRL